MLEKSPQSVYQTRRERPSVRKSPQSLLTRLARDGKEVEGALNLSLPGCKGQGFEEAPNLSFTRQGKSRCGIIAPISLY